MMDSHEGTVMNYVRRTMDAHKHEIKDSVSDISKKRNKYTKLILSTIVYSNTIVETCLRSRSYQAPLMALGNTIFKHVLHR